MLLVLYLGTGIGLFTGALLSRGSAKFGICTGNWLIVRVECGGTGGAGLEPNPLADVYFGVGK